MVRDKMKISPTIVNSKGARSEFLVTSNFYCRHFFRGSPRDLKRVRSHSLTAKDSRSRYPTARYIMEKGDDPYKILEVGKTASETEIKKSYRKLALKHHPDRQQDAAAKEKAQHIFAKISAAYEVLSDEKKRKEYDSLQKEQKSNSKSGCARGFDSRKMDVVFNDPCK